MSFFSVSQLRCVFFFSRCHTRSKEAQVICGICLRSLGARFEFSAKASDVAAVFSLRRRVEPAGHAFHAVHEKPKLEAKKLVKCEDASETFYHY